MDINTKLMSAATAWKEARQTFLEAVAKHGEESSEAEEACGVLADAEDALTDAIDDAPTQAMFASNLLFAQCRGTA